MTGRKAIQLEGNRFDRLYVTGRSVRRARHALWVCWCDCGKIVVAESLMLRKGRVRSCGCHSAEQSRARRIAYNISRKAVSSMPANAG